jgi:predicted TIM-barrel fold metal-dependent hydrolase
MMAGRIATIGRDLPAAKHYPGGMMPEFKKLYYDVVSLFDPNAFFAARQLAGIPRLLFGSDYPYWSPGVTVATLAKHDVTVAERRAIERENALTLFPRFKP